MIGNETKNKQKTHATKMSSSAALDHVSLWTKNAMAFQIVQMVVTKKMIYASKLIQLVCQWSQMKIQ